MDWDTLLNHKRRRDPDRMPTDTRAEFARDFDRALFSAPVRRLQDKAQVFPLDPNDSVRTRLTHSLEVSNLSRSLARRACGNVPDMKSLTPDDKWAIECISATAGLLHDLGNPPFGHAGEQAIQDWFATHKTVLGPLSAHPHADQVKQDFLKFEGNAHTIRLACRLQVMVDDNGLNFTYGTLSALRKYTCPSHQNSKRKDQKKPGHFYSEQDRIDEIDAGCETKGNRNPLAFLVEAADDLAYSTVDLEDGMTKGAFQSWEHLFDLIESKLHTDDSKELLSDTRNKIGKQLKDAPFELTPRQKDATAAQIMRTKLIGVGIDSVSAAFHKRYDEIMDGEFSDDLAGVCSVSDLIAALKMAGRERVYNMASTLKLEVAGRHILHDLLDLYWEPIQHASDVDGPASGFSKKIWGLLSLNYKSIFAAAMKEAGGDEAKIQYARLQLLTDYICGMTDGFAQRLWRELGHG